MKKLFGIGIFGLALIARANAADVFVHIGTPPPPREVVVVHHEPPEYVMVPDKHYWKEHGKKWTKKAKGYWAAPPRHCEWVPGYWAPRPGGRIWIEGYWRSDED